MTRNLTSIAAGQAAAVAVVEYFQQVAPAGVLENRQPPSSMTSTSSQVRQVVIPVEIEAMVDRDK